MAENYLFYSSLTLFAMSSLTLVLSIFFRLKYHEMNKFSGNLSATVFNKTFNVFDPYPERRKIIHNFLSALPLIVVLASFVLVVFSLRVFESGLLLSLALLIICLNLMLVQVASDTYQNAKIFIKAFNNKADLGVGDLKAIQTLKRALPKLSIYYLALTILLITLAATLNHIWSSLLWFFAQFASLILKVGAFTGSTIGYLIAVFLFVLMVSIIQIFIWKIKRKFLSHLLGG